MAEGGRGSSTARLQGLGGAVLQKSSTHRISAPFSDDLDGKASWRLRHIDLLSATETQCKPNVSSCFNNRILYISHTFVDSWTAPFISEVGLNEL